MTARTKDQERAAHNFLVKWCIAMAVLACLVGALLPLFVSSPAYP